MTMGDARFDVRVAACERFMHQLLAYCETGEAIALPTQEEARAIAHGHLLLQIERDDLAEIVKNDVFRRDDDGELLNEVPEVVTKHALELAIFSIKLRSYCWGGEVPPMLSPDAAAALSIAWDQLLVLREAAIETKRMLVSWEQEQMQLARRELSPETTQKVKDAEAKRQKDERDRRRQISATRRAERTDEILARGMA